jgi:hypothetical protein
MLFSAAVEVNRRSFLYVKIVSHPKRILVGLRTDWQCILIWSSFARQYVTTNFFLLLLIKLIIINQIATIIKMYVYILYCRYNNSLYFMQNLQTLCFTYFFVRYNTMEFAAQYTSAENYMFFPPQWMYTVCSCSFIYIYILPLIFFTVIIMHSVLKLQN